MNTKKIAQLLCVALAAELSCKANPRNIPDTSRRARCPENLRFVGGASVSATDGEFSRIVVPYYVYEREVSPSRIRGSCFTSSTCLICLAL